MPARKSTGARPSPSPSASTYSDDPDKDDDAYKLKRKRNNDAVKKTRAKSREQANERKLRVESLERENLQLAERIKQKKENLNTLTDLVLHNVKKDDRKKVMQEILEAPTDEDD